MVYDELAGLLVHGVPFSVGCVLYVMKNWLRATQQSARDCHCSKVFLQCCQRSAAWVRYLASAQFSVYDNLSSTEKLCVG